MSSRTKTLDLDLEELDDDELNDAIEEALDINDNDYGFIISSDGELKTFFGPEEPPEELPKEILRIFKIFKIKNPEDYLPKVTLH